MIAEKTLKIGSKIVGKNQPIFVIAEAGVNHNGRLDLALKLVEEAARAKADAVKFQTFKAENLAIPSCSMANYQQKNLKTKISQQAMLKQLELKESFYQPIIQRCQEKKITFLSTAHSGFEAVDFLNKLNVKAFKFGSGDLTNLPLLEYAAKLKKPIILGAGMATLAEVKEATATIQKAGNQQIIILHCTTSYPCPDNQVNLRAMQTIMQELDVLVGFSDHTLGQTAPLLAVGSGVVMIEKHFTLSRKMAGPDQRASQEPKELALMIETIRKAETILGRAEKKPTKSEKLIIPVCRKSIVAQKDIRKGELFNKDNLAIKRPGTGLAPKLYQGLLGKKAKRYIKVNSLIKKNDYI